MSLRRGLGLTAAVLGMVALMSAPAWAQSPTGLPSVTINSGGASPDQSLEILALLTFLTFLPAILITMTAFTRVVTVLSFLRTALGLQQTPPNQVLIGLALFPSLYIMLPTWNAVNHQAIAP
jgi:flagellar biosynthetic protein FliP